MRFTKNKILGFLLLAIAAVAPAHASLVFNTTFDSSVTSLSNAAQWESAFNYATSFYSNLFSDNITINLTLDASPGTSILGESTTQLAVLNSGYPQMLAVLTADQTTPNDATAVSNLPATDPITGPQAWVVSTAQGKALGLIAGNASASDGTVTMGTGYSYTFDPNNRAVPNEYDFIGVAEHEISEVMGRIGLLGANLGSGNLAHSYGALDLFGYTGPGDPSLGINTTTPVYFSIDGGVSDLIAFNNPGNGGDSRDWASGQGNDSYNAFSGSGVENNVSAVDLEEMDVIGYDFVGPEPASFLPLLAGIAWIGYRLRRKAA